MSAEYRKGIGPAVAALLSCCWWQCQGDSQIVCTPTKAPAPVPQHQQQVGVLEALSSLLSTWCALKVAAVKLSDKVHFFFPVSFVVLLLGGRSCKLMILRKVMYHLNDLEKSWIYSDQWKKSHWLKRKYIFHLWFSQTSLEYGKKNGQRLLIVGFF